ncbi:MAG: VTT domain-containing protein [Candidatus Moraniibacteriota bacterium]
MPVKIIIRFIKFAGAALVTATAILLISPASDRVVAVLYDAIFWVENLIHTQPLLGAASFVLLSALSAILAFASSIPLVPSAILVWGMPLTFFLLLSGWVFGSIITYWVGVWFARPTLAFLITEEKLVRYEKLASAKTRFWMILVFCLAVPSEIPGLILGAMRYSFAKFIAAVILAETVYAFGSVLIAQNILDKEIFSTGGIILFLIAVVTLAAALTRLQYKKPPKE